MPNQLITISPEWVITIVSELRMFRAGGKTSPVSSNRNGLGSKRLGMLSDLVSTKDFHSPISLKLQMTFPTASAIWRTESTKAFSQFRDFFSEIQAWIDRQDRKTSPLLDLRGDATKRIEAAKSNPAEAKDYFMRFKTDFSRTMFAEAAKAYGDGGASEIRDGSRLGLLDDTDADDLLETLKGVARKFLYIDEKVQRPFLAGLRIVHGILDEYGELLELTGDDFALLRSAWKSADRAGVHKKKLHTLPPLLDRLPAHYLDVYDSSVKETESLKEWGEDPWEWFCRAHLIVDYLSGMTDDFAYRSYQVISGAKLE